MSGSRPKDPQHFLYEEKEGAITPEAKYTEQQRFFPAASEEKSDSLSQPEIETLHKRLAEEYKDCINIINDKAFNDIVTTLISIRRKIADQEQTIGKVTAENANDFAAKLHELLATYQTQLTTQRSDNARKQNPTEKPKRFQRNLNPAANPEGTLEIIKTSICIKEIQAKINELERKFTTVHRSDSPSWGPRNS